MTSFQRRCSLGLLGLMLAGAPGAVAQAPDDAATHRGYLAARLTRAGALEVVAASGADRFLVPASVLKVVTVAAVLDHLGPDHRWVTRLLAAGPVDDGVLAGDLLLEPGGDPTWSDGLDGVDDAAAPLADLAAQIRAGGIRRVAGDLVVDLTRFPGRMHPTDRGYGDLPYQFGTPPAALALDDATISVRVTPGARLGAPAGVTAPAGVEILNLTTTVGPERRGNGTLDFLPVWETDTLLLRGEYPINEPAFVVATSDPAPVLRAARRLRDALGAAGVALDGAVRLRRSGAVASGAPRTVAEVRSPPLAAVLERVLTESHNWTADMLVLSLGREVAGTGRFDDGVEVVTDFVERVTGRAGPADRAAWLVDGSGLSPNNLVTPRAVVEVLAHAVRQPWGRTLVDALGRPGQGTLETWPPLPPVAAKTGTLAHTVGLAGVLRPDGDAPVLFCYLVNHSPAPAAAARREIAAALARW